MAKSKDDYLDIEAMKLGYRIMLEDVNQQLEAELSPALKAVLIDQQTTITKRLEELK